MNNSVSISRSHADMVLMLIDIIEGQEEHIDRLHAKLGITGKEGFPRSDWATIDEKDKESRLFWSAKRIELANAIADGLGYAPAQPRLTVIDGGL
jgi:hypothetical protein